MNYLLLIGLRESRGGPARPMRKQVQADHTTFIPAARMQITWETTHPRSAADRTVCFVLLRLALI